MTTFQGWCFKKSRADIAESNYLKLKSKRIKKKIKKKKKFHIMRKPKLVGFFYILDVEVQPGISR